MRYSSSLLGLPVLYLPAVLGALQIIPGATWTADNGLHMQAHGAGVIQVNSTYYLIGEDHTDGSAFQNLNCYASEDLVQWRYVGALLSRTGSGDLGPNRIAERPKVIYNDKTGKYVLWFHADDSSYSQAKVGVATGDSVCGKYDYIGSFQPLNYQSRDMGLFKDDDGTAYLLSEDRQNGVRIDKLTDDYLQVAGPTYLWPDHIEAPAMLKYKGRYYFFGSHLTGWDPNDNVYSTSTSLTSGWTDWQIFADKGSNTYDSQTNYILPYGDTIMYMGDRWISSDLMASTYVWLPLSVSGTSVSMKNLDSWVPNVDTGAWAPAPSSKAYEGEVGTVGGKARVVSCNNCSGKKAMGYIGGSDAGTVTIGGVTGSGGAGLTTVDIRYVDGDSTPRYANVIVNGGSPIKLAFLPSGSDVSSSSLNVQLNASDNTFEIGGVNGGWGPDIDQIVVPTS